MIRWYFLLQAKEYEAASDIRMGIVTCRGNQITEVFSNSDGEIQKHTEDVSSWTVKQIKRKSITKVFRPAKRREVNFFKSQAIISLINEETRP